MILFEPERILNLTYYRLDRYTVIPCCLSLLRVCCFDSRSSRMCYRAHFILISIGPMFSSNPIQLCVCVGWIQIFVFPILIDLAGKPFTLPDLLSHGLLHLPNHPSSSTPPLSSSVIPFDRSSTALPLSDAGSSGSDEVMAEFPLLALQEHPSTAEPIWGLHPCHATEAVEEVLSSEVGRRRMEESRQEGGSTLR